MGRFFFLNADGPVEGFEVDGTGGEGGGADMVSLRWRWKSGGEKLIHRDSFFDLVTLVFSYKIPKGVLSLNY